MNTNTEVLVEARSKRRDRSIQQPWEPSSDEKRLNRSYQEITLDLLVPFANHPFRPYDENRLNDMVESIKESGVISPITVRPLGKDGKYEILAGHNRVNAARQTGLQSIPAEILKGLTDDDAKLIVVESNLIQRSFKDMNLSEQAAAISTLYHAMKKKPGYRSDLLEGIEKATCSPVANRSRTMKKLGTYYDLSKDTIARYLRISQLTGAFQDMLDNRLLPVRAAVDLSYLSVEEQTMVEELLREDEKVSMEQAKMLREISSKGGLTPETAEQILREPPQKAQRFTLSNNLFAQYFREDQTMEEIEQIITEALDMYFHRKE